MSNESVEFNTKITELTIEQIRKIQQIMLDILIEVDKVCEKLNIKYWLDSGTLLGAVRHKGFIPWDDDLDICMTVEDYQKFLNEGQKYLPSDLFIQHRYTDKYYPKDFMKIRSNKGKVLERGREKPNAKYNQGIYIDIFPNMTIQNNKQSIKKYLLLMKAKKNIAEKYLDLNRFNLFFLRKYFINKSLKLHQGWDTSKDLLVVRTPEMTYDMHFKIHIKDLFPLQKIEFEGYEFLAPNNVDVYLKELYGDNYMQLPPVEERKPHFKKAEIYM